MKYNITSLILHLILFTFVGSSSTKIGISSGNTGNSKFQGNRDAGQIEKKTQKVDFELISNDTTKKELVIKQKKKKVNVDKECPNQWYGGIGIRAASTINTNNEVIYEIFEGYPADLAGLKINDEILEIDSEAIVGVPGSILRLNVIRNGKVLGFTIQRSKICYNVNRR